MGALSRISAFPSAVQDALFPATSVAAANAFVPSAASVADAAAPPAAFYLHRHAVFRAADVPCPAAFEAFADLSLAARTAFPAVSDISGPASSCQYLEAPAARAPAGPSHAPHYPDAVYCFPLRFRAPRSRALHSHAVRRLEHSDVFARIARRVCHGDVEAPLRLAARPDVELREADRPA